jgi:hypothetical protein
MHLCLNPTYGVIRQLRTTIQILNDDSLLNVFYFCRSSVFEEDEDGVVQLADWDSERWWYKFVQVCRRWRYLILGSASHLRLSLLCTCGTPVADMLEHSPPLPLIIHYNDENYDVTADEEEGIILALQHRDRIRRICLYLPIPSLQKLITAIDDEFPILEYMLMTPPAKHDTQLIIPSTCQAPQLRHLVLEHFSSPIGSPLLTSAVGIVFLLLRWIHPSTYPHPNHLLQSLSFLPQLERLEIGFLSPIPSREIERQLLRTPITTHITLSHLRWFDFRGISAYLESLLPQIITPRLGDLRLRFFNQPSISVPHLRQFIRTTENFRFSNVKFLFYHQAVAVRVYPPIENASANFYLEVTCEHLDWQVSSVAQIFNVLRPLFSDVIDLTLGYKKHSLSSEWHNQADRTLWRELLGSFGGVKTLRVHKGLVAELSRSLRLDGEPPLEILPGLKELGCPVGTVDDNTFAAFIQDREVVGQPVSLIEEAFPASQRTYWLFSSTGEIVVEADPDPLP